MGREGEVQSNYQMDLDDLMTQCGKIHGHIYPRQVLGIRMAVLSYFQTASKRSPITKLQLATQNGLKYFVKN
jgi:hypothetical protein